MLATEESESVLVDDEDDVATVAGGCPRLLLFRFSLEPWNSSIDYGRLIFDPQHSEYCRPKANVDWVTVDFHSITATGRRSNQLIASCSLEGKDTVGEGKDKI